MLRRVLYEDKIIEYEIIYKVIKNINMRIKPNGSVFVSCRQEIPLEKLDEFVLINAEKILSFQNKCKLPISTALGDGESFFILGEQKIIQNIISNKYEAYISDNYLIIGSPIGTNEAKKKDILVRLLEKTCREETEKILYNNPFLIDNPNIKKPSFSYRKMSSRWGSCSPTKNKIVINKLLACTPPKCIRYVIYHELVHLLYPNHAQAFYKCLEGYIPDYKKIKKALSNYSISLFDF